MFDLEVMEELRIIRIVRWHKDSDNSIKAACIAAAWVVGLRNGGTAEIAKRTKRSVSSIENWAHAFKLYQELRQNLSDFKKARALWRFLPASHWWLAHDIQAAGYDALYYLNNAMLNGWSGRDMLKEFAQDREGGSAPLIFRRACLSFRGLASELLKHHKQLTPAQRKAAEAVAREFE